MATEAQRARRRAQRATAIRVRNKQTILPESYRTRIRQSRVEQGYRWVNGIDPMPAKDSVGARIAAQLAGLARWGKADPVFEQAFAQYWYHDDKLPEPDNDDEIDYDEAEDEE
jgi:hypothetical protein